MKRSVLDCLSTLGKWTVLPMFTAGTQENDKWTQNARHAYQGMLGRDVELLSNDLVPVPPRRETYFAQARREHLFLDPDTGFRVAPIAPTDRKSAPSYARYLYMDELRTLVDRQTDRPLLTSFFDQSLCRSNRRAIHEKLNAIRDQGMLAFAYRSHACFVVVAKGDDGGELLQKARACLEAWGIPGSRFVDAASDS